MKKKTLLYTACFFICTVFANAQTKQSPLPVLPPPPPPALLPPPPPPPKPVRFTPPRIIKDGIDFKIYGYNGNTIVTVYKNKKKVDKVDMKEWEANKAFYEKKYGMLPPPPPPLIMKKDV